MWNMQVWGINILLYPDGEYKNGYNKSREHLDDHYDLTHFLVEIVIRKSS